MDFLFLWFGKLRAYFGPQWNVLSDRIGVFLIVPPWGTVLHRYLSTHPTGSEFEEYVQLLFWAFGLCWGIKFLYEDHQSYVKGQTTFVSPFTQMLCMAYAIALFVASFLKL